MSLNNIKLNASPASKKLTDKLETELVLQNVDPNVVRQLFDSTIPVAMMTLNRLSDECETREKFTKAKEILQFLAEKSTDSLPLSRPKHTVSTGRPRWSSATDSLLSDINEALLFGRISDKFEISYLSVVETENVACFEVDVTRAGLIYGEHARPMIALPCHCKGQPPRWVFFIVDTGAPSTELSPTAMDRVCNADTVPSCIDLYVGGVKVEVMLCDQGPNGNHKDVPVLGKNFFLKAGCILNVNYLDLTCSVLRQV